MRIWGIMLKVQNASIVMRRDFIYMHCVAGSKEARRGGRRVYSSGDAYALCKGALSRAAQGDIAAALAACECCAAGELTYKCAVNMRAHRTK